MAEKKLSFTQNATFNTVGVLINNLCLWLTTLVVVRLSSDYANAGIWQLSISVTNVFFAISQFNLVPFLVTDINKENDLSDYAATQLFTSIIAILLCSLYSVFCGYQGMQLACIIAYMLVRVIETFSSFLFGVDQIHYRMDYAGVSLALRGFFDLIAFAVALFFTKNIVVAIASMAIVSLVVMFVMGYRQKSEFE